ncbi:MAG: hypothetical protein Q8L27_04935 [archaeon]|nr:hypothetical protein [archaeon]
MAKRNEDFLVSALTAPFLVYILFLVVRELSAANNDIAFWAYAIWFIFLVAVIYYVVEGVRRRYG